MLRCWCSFSIEVLCCLNVSFRLDLNNFYIYTEVLGLFQYRGPLLLKCVLSPWCSETFRIFTKFQIDAEVWGVSQYWGPLLFECVLSPWSSATSSSMLRFGIFSVSGSCITFESVLSPWSSATSWIVMRFRGSLSIAVLFSLNVSFRLDLQQRLWSSRSSRSRLGFGGSLSIKVLFSVNASFRLDLQQRLRSSRNSRSMLRFGISLGIGVLCSFECVSSPSSSEPSRPTGMYWALFRTEVLLRLKLSSPPLIFTKF